MVLKAKQSFWLAPARGKSVPYEPPAVAPLLPSHMRFNPIANPNWQKQNGVSLLTATGKARAPFFLAMGDHLFESSILAQLVAHADLDTPEMLARAEQEAQRLFR